MHPREHRFPRRLCHGLSRKSSQGHGHQIFLSEEFLKSKQMIESHLLGI